MFQLSGNSPRSGLDPITCLFRAILSWRGRLIVLKRIPTITTAAQPLPTRRGERSFALGLLIIREAPSRTSPFGARSPILGLSPRNGLNPDPKPAPESRPHNLDVRPRFRQHPTMRRMLPMLIGYPIHIFPPPRCKGKETRRSVSKWIFGAQAAKPAE